MNIKGEKIERVQAIMGHGCKGDPAICPCIMHFNQRQRIAEDSRSEPQQSHIDQLDSWTRKIMGTED